MRYKKFAATALLAVAATGVTAGTSYAAPTPPAAQDQSAAAPTVTGTDQGVGYALQLADAGKSVVTSVTGGAFSVDTDNRSVTLKNSAGETVTSIPLTATAKGQEVNIAAAVADEGRQLTLTPQVAPTANAPVAAEFIGAQEWFFAELQRASLGALVGGLIGAAIGIVFFGVGILPGAVLGALIGLAVAGGPSLLNAGIAYFSGQP
ncbi:MULTISPECIES: hypothetical protein [Nocardia]|jgi:hypothetical protein|uniref:DUF8020 domain-containing protein n=1 Tax=Nocardia gamkensis TaxID=352869 RepID=A0A7X6R116_9NOCA|nr:MULTISPECIES: hypothetical protein [Nocardia]NKY24790.1 hypothetical protein [Nocardia gamkensis]NQE66567.1 hypothetical protein [Nocardia gamkensis]